MREEKGMVYRLETERVPKLTAFANKEGNNSGQREQ
jgi:hypothetical protein